MICGHWDYKGVQLPIMASAREDDSDALRINPFLSQRPAKADGSVNKIRPPPAVLQKVVKRESKVVQEDCYSNENESRGVCLILEHDSFAPNLQLSGRAGSEADLKAAVKCFTKLGFEVHIHRNLRYSDIMNLLEEVAVIMDHSGSDCFVMILLSHGNLGTVYAYDAPYPTQKLWEPFTADRSPSLAGKPKLFFLQACQGSQMDEGVLMTKATETDGIAFASYKVPMHADFLISHSTISGYYSWRNTAAGSWFIQSLVAALEKEANARDVCDILTMVNRRVALEYESNSSRKEFNHKKQTPFFYSTLTLKLYWDEKK